MAADRTLRIREFAKLASVSVRALHHYDRLGLLQPRRTRSGYRVYSAKDLQVLEQIIALKFIGLPLDQIKPLLRKRRTDLSRALRAQRTLLEHKKCLLERAIEAIGRAERTLRDGEDDGAVFSRIIEVIEMQSKNEEWKQKYDSLVQRKLEALRSMSPESRAQLQTEWMQLLKDVDAALDEDPASGRAQLLADRYMKVLGAFVPNGTVDAQLVRSFGTAYPPTDEWPTGVPKPEGLAADPKIWTFIRSVLAVRASR